MTYDFKNFLALMAKSRKLLIFDDGYLLKNHKEVMEMFNSYFYNSIQEDAIAKLQSTLISTQADVVVVNGQSSKHILEICQKVSEFDPKIVITALLQNKDDGTCHKIVEIADSVIYLPFQTESFYKKLSIALSAQLMMYKMSHTLNTHKKFLNETGIESYLNAYRDDVSIIHNTLKEYSLRLQCGDLNQELFYSIATELESIGKIFTYHHYTAKVSMIFDELAAFLRHYDLEDVEISKLEGFDFLVTIIDDISKYLHEFFIQRIFLDVYVFEHSLRDTIAFMINRLTENKKIESDLEFFE